jgi:hypothetical protein
MVDDELQIIIVSHSEFGYSYFNFETFLNATQKENQ